MPLCCPLCHPSSCSRCSSGADNRISNIWRRAAPHALRRRGALGGLQRGPLKQHVVILAMMLFMLLLQPLLLLLLLLTGTSAAPASAAIQGSAVMVAVAAP
jgi:hypothetical protein